MNNANPKVTIILPSLNVGNYIRQCIESVVSQTLQEIEIICVDAGSTDETLPILQEYQSNDSRIQILHSDKKSYGYQMNLGLIHAKGEYIGIVETDDFIEPDMFLKLYNCAKEYDCDVVKAGFWLYWSTPEEIDEPYYVASRITAGRTFCPISAYTVPMEQLGVFNLKNSIWSAVYKRSYLDKEQIRFLETPGASYQDTAFAIKIWLTAQRVRFLTDCFLHYRQDNENSSVNSPGKVFCICDEYDEIWHYLEDRPLLKMHTVPLIVRVQYDAYMWNYVRLNRNEEGQKEFLERFYQTFKAHELNGSLSRDYFEDYKWSDLQLLLEDPSEFYKKKTMERFNVTYTRTTPLYYRTPSKTKRNLTPVIQLPTTTRMKIKAKAGLRYLKANGIIATAKKTIHFVNRRIHK